MKIKIIKQGENIIDMPLCGKCEHRLHYKEWRNERGVPCITTDEITENYCPNCGERVEL